MEISGKLVQGRVTVGNIHRMWTVRPNCRDKTMLDGGGVEGMTLPRESRDEYRPWAVNRVTV